MGGLLMRYLNERMQTSIKSFLKNTDREGLLVTISREAGCGGRDLCEVLARELNENHPSRPWKVISKEILYRTATDLNVPEGKVERILKSDKNYALEEIFSALNEKYYKNNKQIIKWVRNEIYNFSQSGYTILLGRAGHIIANDIPGAIHVRFVAPLDWRIGRLADINKCSRQEAHNLIKKIEEERNNFKNHFLKPGNKQENFDLTIDVSRFPPAVIAGIIIYAFQSIVTSPGRRNPEVSE